MLPSPGFYRLPSHRMSKYWEGRLLPSHALGLKKSQVFFCSKSFTELLLNVLGPARGTSEAGGRSWGPESPGSTRTAVCGGRAGRGHGELAAHSLGWGPVWGAGAGSLRLPPWFLPCSVPVPSLSVLGLVQCQPRREQGEFHSSWVFGVLGALSGGRVGWEDT